MRSDWPEICRAIGAEVAAAVTATPPGSARSRVLGTGTGGDETTAVDDLAERIVLARLEEVAKAGESLVVVSEEAGELGHGHDPSWWVIVDPIDGSLNAKRGLPYYSLSIAVADAPRMAGVRFAYVRDLVSGEEWTAERGRGAALDGRRLDPVIAPDRLELVELSGTSAALVAGQAPALVGQAEKLRIMGSIALSLCQLAAGRLDAVVSLQPIRSVDIAAAQLLVLEQGLTIELPDAAPFVAAPLDLVRRSRVVAAACPAHVRQLARALGPSTARC